MIRAPTVIGIALCCLSLALLGWSALPVQEVHRQFTLPGLLTDLYCPASLQVGQTGRVRLETRLEQATQTTTTPGGTPGTTKSGQDGQPLLSDLLDSYNLVAQASLELPGMVSAPSSEIEEPLRPGYAAVFVWDVRAEKENNYPGKLWLHLRLAPLPRCSNCQEGRRLIGALPLEVRAGRLFGLDYDQVRLLGAAGLVGSVALLVLSQVSSRQ
jgi:hypothetical protein